MSILALLQTSCPEGLGVSAVQLEQKAVNLQGFLPNNMPPAVMLSPYALLAQTSQPQFGQMLNNIEPEDTDNELLGLSSENVPEGQKAPVVNVEATHGTIDLEDDMLAKPASNTDSERPPAQANTQLSTQMQQHMEKGHQKKEKTKAKAKAKTNLKGQAIEQKNDEIRSKITMLEDQIKKEEGLARKLKGDQVSLKAKEQMTEIESHLDKQINSLRNDLKISGQEAKLARLRAEQAVISEKIKGGHDDKKHSKALKKHQKPGNSLADARQHTSAKAGLRDAADGIVAATYGPADVLEHVRNMYREGKREFTNTDILDIIGDPEGGVVKTLSIKFMQDGAEEEVSGTDAEGLPITVPELVDEEAEAAAAAEAEAAAAAEAEAAAHAAEEEEAAKAAEEAEAEAAAAAEEEAKAAEEAAAAEDDAAADAEEAKKAEEEAAAAAAADAEKDAQTKELLEVSKKMMEQSEAMQESLKKVEENLEEQKKSADEVGGEPLNGWDSVKKYFKGEAGIPKAKKFVKFLNLLTKMEEDTDSDSDDEI